MNQPANTANLAIDFAKMQIKFHQSCSLVFVVGSLGTIRDGADS